jgi:hypothetical protein
MGFLRRPPAQFLGLGAVWGVVAFLMALAKVSGVALVLYLLIAATAFAAGYAARAAGRRPAWHGAGAGALYGVIGALAVFASPITASELRRALQARHVSTGTSTLLHVVNSPAVHLVSVVASGLVWGLVGLILGAIGGAVAGGAEASRRAV